MTTKTATLRLQLHDGVSGPAAGVTKALQDLDQRIKGFEGQIRKARWQLLDAAAGFAAFGAAVAGPVRQAMRFEDAMADVAKVVDFETPEAFKAMGEDVLKLSQRLPMAADGIAAIVAAAGQSGLAQNELLGFADVAVKVATAWDTTAHEAGESLAKLKTALGLTVPETALLADALNHLSNNTAASATDLLNFTRRVAPMASAFGLTAEQAAALGAGMVGAGFEAEVAATSFMNMGRALTSGAGATKRQRAALKSLGLDSKRVALDMQRDATGTIQDVFRRLREAPDHLRAAMITDIFGAEARALTPLIMNAELLANALKLVAERSEYAGSSQAEFEARSKTTSNTLQLLRNRVSALGISFGSAFLPTVNDAARGIGGFADSARAFVERNPALVRNLTLATGGLLGLRVAAAASRLGFLVLGKQSLTLARGFLVAGAAVSGAAKVVAAFATAKVVSALAAGTRAARTFALAASLSGVGPAAAAAMGSIGRGALAMLNPVRLATAALVPLKWAMRGLLIGTGVGTVLVGLGMAAEWVVLNFGNLKVAAREFSRAFQAGIAPLRDDPTFKRLAGDAGELLQGFRRLTSEGDVTAFAEAGAAAGKRLADAFLAVAGTLDRVVAAVKFLKGELAGFAEFQQQLNQIGLNIGKSIGTDKVGGWLKRQVGLGGEPAAPGDKGRLERFGVNVGVEVPRLDLKGVTASLPPVKPTFDLAGFEGAARTAGEGAGAVLGAGVGEALKGQQPRVLGDFGGIMAGLRSAASAGVEVPVRLRVPSLVGISAPSIGAPAPAPRPGAAPVKVDGAREKGGPVEAGGTYLVGERGPELVIPQRDGFVLPNSRTPAALGGSAPAPRPVVPAALRAASVAAALAVPTALAAQPARLALPDIPALQVSAPTLSAGDLYRHAAKHGERPLAARRPAGERDENEVRKDFTVSERVAIGRAVEEALGNRQGQRTDRGGAGLVQNIAQVAPGAKTRKIAAEKSGFGNSETYRQAKSVVDKGAPELVAAVDTGKASVSAAAPASAPAAAPAPSITVNAPVTVNIKAGDGTPAADIAARVEAAVQKALGRMFGSLDRQLQRRQQTTHANLFHGDF